MSRSFLGLINEITPAVMAFCIFIVSMLTGCSYFNKQLGLKDDNLAEEISEVVIKNYTGLDVDLTPESPE